MTNNKKAAASCGTRAASNTSINSRNHTAFDDDAQVTESILPLDDSVKLRYVVGRFRGDSASGLNPRRSFAVCVKEVDICSQPCTCHIHYPCIACASFDARCRERDARAGSLK